MITTSLLAGTPDGLQSDGVLQLPEATAVLVAAITEGAVRLRSNRRIMVREKRGEAVLRQSTMPAPESVVGSRLLHKPDRRQATLPMPALLSFGDNNLTVIVDVVLKVILASDYRFTG
jgi:hypothetical protein